MDIKLFETSAKENINVEEMFRAVTELVLRAKLEQQARMSTQDQGKHESGIKLTGTNLSFATSNQFLSGRFLFWGQSY